MSSPTAEALSCSPYEACSCEELEQLLMRVPGVEWRSTKPIHPRTKPNHFGVSHKIRLQDGGKQLPRRSACTEPDGPVPTLHVALVLAIQAACRELGQAEPVAEAAAESARQREAEPEPPTPAEHEWLAEWCESHANPDSITVSMADEELRAQRASTSSAAATTSALSILQEVQLVRAQVRAESE